MEFGTFIECFESVRFDGRRREALFRDLLSTTPNLSALREGELSILGWAIAERQETFALQLVDRGVAFTGTVGGDSVVAAAAGFGCIRLARAMLERGGRFDGDAHKLVQRLLDRHGAVSGAEPSPDLPELVKRLVTQPNVAPGGRPLIVCALDVESARVLLEMGADPDVPSALEADRGNTALHRAAALGLSSLVDVLVAAGAKKTIVNRDGKTAAMLAFEARHLSIAARLGRAPPRKRSASGKVSQAA